MAKKPPKGCSPCRSLTPEEIAALEPKISKPLTPEQIAMKQVREAAIPDSSHMTPWSP